MNAKTTTLSVLTTLALAAGLAGCVPLETVTTEPTTATTQEAAPPAQKPLEPAPKPKPEPEKPSMTVSQEQAIIAADSYLNNIGGFSRAGLIDQLEYEGFSADDATFAVDSLGINWNDQAALAAASYMENLGGFSRAGLVEQLIYEGFSADQADYGVGTVGL